MLRLLIVDDEIRTREGLKKCLPWSALGIGEIEEADDGNTALDIAEKFHPDIILTDIRMPNMEGIEFIRRLRHNSHECKVIFISGYSDKEYLKAAIQLKAVSYVEKPVNINELKNAIQDAVNMCRQEKKSFEHFSVLEKSRPIIIQDFALYLTEPGNSREELERHLELTGLNLNIDSYYISILFKLYNIGFNSDKLYDLRDNFINLTCSTFSSQGITNITGFKNESHIISHICLNPNSNLHNIKKILECLTTDFNTKFAGTGSKLAELSIGVGTSVQGMGLVFQSYQTAVIAEQRSFFSGMGKTLYYENSSGTGYAFDNSLEEKFSECIRNEDSNKTLSFVKELSSDIKKHVNSLPHNVKAFYYRLLLILIRESEKRNLILQTHEHKRDQLWNKMLDFYTLEQIEKYLLDKIEEYFHLLNEKSDKGKSVYEIMKYINSNYHKKELDLNSISGYVHLTPAYVCQIFKKETGKTINEYLTDFRLEKAKELLKGGTNKLYEVSSDIGYNDTKYFIKTFKRKTGMTPTEYREKYS